MCVNNCALLMCMLAASHPHQSPNPYSRFPAGTILVLKGRNRKPYKDSTVQFLRFFETRKGGTYQNFQLIFYIFLPSMLIL